MIQNSSRVFRKGVVFCLLFVIIFSNASPVFAQVNDLGGTDMMFGTTQKPPMENVMYNTFWGAALGAIIFVTWSTLDDTIPVDQRFGFSRLSDQMFQGATLGGIIGLILGTYFSMTNITFDPNLTRIAENGAHQNDFHAEQYHSNLNSFGKNQFKLVNLRFDF